MRALPNVDPGLPRGKLITCTITAGMIGRSSRWLEDQCKGGTHPFQFWRISGRYLFDEADVIAYIKANHVPARR